MNTRVVRAGHGHAATMGYKYRARVETRTKRVGWFSNRREVQVWWVVIEKCFISWRDHKTSRDFRSEEEAVTWANNTLDDLSATPGGKYVGDDCG